MANNNSQQAPLYSSHEKAVILHVSSIPEGYVTSLRAVAQAISGRQDVPSNARNISRTMKNLEGRSNIPDYRVLRAVPGGCQTELTVRDDAHIFFLRGEGVDISDAGRLLSSDLFWDFSDRCKEAYAKKMGAATAVGTSNAEDPTTTVSDGAIDDADGHEAESGVAADVDDEAQQALGNDDNSVLLQALDEAVDES